MTRSRGGAGHTIGNAEACETLLVNYWYANPIGHALEGMRYALGYKAANPHLEISLLLNCSTAVELARLCTFLDATYAVPYTDFVQDDADPARALAGVPTSWDWVVENHRDPDPVALDTSGRCFL